MSGIGAALLGVILSSLLSGFTVEGLNTGVGGLFEWVMKTVYAVITADFTGLTGFQMSNTVRIINDALVPIGSSLVTILILIHFIQSCSTIVEYKRPDKIFMVLVRLILANALVINSFPILQEVYNLGAKITKYLLDSAGFDPNAGFSVPAPSGAGLTLEASLGGLIAILIAIIALIAMVVSACSIIFTVIGRFYKIYMYAIVAPIPLATLGYSETSRMGKSFLHSFVGICIEGLVIAAACVLFGSYFSGNGIPMLTAGSTALAEAFAFMGEDGGKLVANEVMLLLQMSIFAGLVRGSDRFVREMIG